MKKKELQPLYVSKIIMPYMVGIGAQHITLILCTLNVAIIKVLSIASIIIFKFLILEFKVNIK